MIEDRAFEAGGTAAARMLWRTERLRGATIGASDGDLGAIDDLYFDDQGWTVRYLVVDTGSWLRGRKVLLSPHAVERVEPDPGRVLTRLTRSQVEQSPPVDTARPVSRQREIEQARYWGFPYYWYGPYRWGPAPYPMALGTPGYAPVERVAPAEGTDPHLRSTNAVRGYGIRATDGDLGHVEDFLVEDGSWAIRYLVVDPRNWWPGRHVVIATDWITRVSWDDARVVVDMTRDAIRGAPPYDPRGSIGRSWEADLHAHHGRRGYWEREPDPRRNWPAA